MSSTPLKPVKPVVVQHCFACGIATYSSLRSVVTNIPVPSTSPVIHQLKTCFSIELHPDIAATLKICISCKKKLQYASQLKEIMAEKLQKLQAILGSLKHEERVKRGRPSEFTPTPVKRPVKRIHRDSSQVYPLWQRVSRSQCV